MSATGREFVSSSGPPHKSRALIDGSPFPMVELEGTRHIIRQANSLFCLLIDKPREFIVGKPYAEVVPDRGSLVVLDRVYRSRSCEMHGEAEQIQAQPADWSYLVWPVHGTADRPLGVVMQVTGPTLLQRARAVNEALMISVVHQHERTDVAETLNVRLESEIVERQRVEAELSRSEARFRALVAMSSDWYWEQDENFRYTELNEPTLHEANFVAAEYLGKTRWELPSSAISKEQWDEHRELLKQHRPFRNLEYQHLNAHGKLIWMSVSGDPVIDSTGNFCGYRGTGRDISERKRHEHQIELIMREVSHREKNVLSLVLAVARQSAAASPEHFLERFSDRLMSISANQALLIENRWEGIEIGALMRSQLAHLQDLVDKRIRFTGPALHLTARAAPIIGMVMHELATNALKYGALANDTGHVEISWHRHEGVDGPRFALSWVECDGPPVERPTRQGFGSTVIGDMAGAGLDAEITLEFPVTGLRWSLDCHISSALEPETSVP